MIWHKCKTDTRTPNPPGIRTLDASFIEHIKQGHVPYRNDCKFCVRGSARRKQHRRVLCPGAWCLSVDSAGPYKCGLSETSKSQRYMIVGVLTVPILELQEKPEDQPEVGPPDEELGGALDDEEFFADGEDETDDPLPPKEIAEAKASQASWDELVKRDQEDWRKEAEKEHLPKVKLVEWPFVEVVPGKTQQNVLNAIRKMRTEALSLGFEVRRIHTDRGREYLNNGLKGFCSQHSIIKTLAFAEEHQSNGRVESLIGRIKAKTRVFLEQGNAPPEEWPMSAKLASLVLQNKARKALHMRLKPIIPYNTQVQVVQRSWRRGAWHSVTVAAHTKGPSEDCDRGWVVVTSDGNYLSTSKVFPSPDDDKKLLVKYEGDPIDPTIPDRRLKGKTAVRYVAKRDSLGEPVHEVDRIASELLEKEDFSPPAVAKVALSLSRLPRAMQGTAPTPVKVKDKGTIFFSGSFSHGGITGVKGYTTEHPWVTAYLAQCLRRASSNPFAAVGLVWNAEQEAHRDCHNQKGVKNVVVPVVTSGGGLWVQSEGLDMQEYGHLEEETREIKPGVHVKGKNLIYEPGIPICFNASKWHASIKSKGQQLLVVGYTPRSLHKLAEVDRRRLWDVGCTFIPGNQDEFWTLDPRRSILTRHHEKPRKSLFVPKPTDVPFSLEQLGNVRYCEQTFGNGDTSRHMHMWRQSKGLLAVRAKWTGRSVFQFVEPGQDCTDLGGGQPAEFLSLNPEPKRLCKVCEDELPHGYGFGRCNGCGILQGLSGDGVPEVPQASGAEVPQASKVTGVPEVPQASGAEVPQASKVTGVPEVPQASGAEVPRASKVTGVPEVPLASGAEVPQASKVTGVPEVPQASGAEVPQASKVTGVPEVPLASGAEVPQASKVTGVPEVPQASGAEVPQASKVTGVPEVPQASGAEVPRASKVTGVPEVPLASGAEVPQASKVTGVPEVPQASGAEVPQASKVTGVPEVPLASGAEVPQASKVTGVPEVPQASGAEVPQASKVTGVPEVPQASGAEVPQASKVTGVPEVPQASGAEVSQASKVTGVPEVPQASGAEVPHESGCKGTAMSDGRDRLDKWYGDDWELDEWESCRFLVPDVAAELRQCACTRLPETMFRLESTPWKMRIDLEYEAMMLAAEHRFRCHALEEDESEDSCAGAETRDADQTLSRLCNLEAQVARLSKAAWETLLSTGTSVSEGTDKLWLGPENLKVRSLRAVQPGQQGPESLGDAPIGGAEEDFLQTRLVSVEEARKDLQAWKPSMVEEYTSLVHTTGTCEPMDQEQFLALTSDPSQKVEVLPGKLVFSIKARSGRKKTRAVGCGNYQKGCPRDKLDKHASGISAEAIRLLIRFAGQAQWTLSTTDIKTAFLNAPLVTPNEEKIVIKVPGILRAANVCAEPYWMVRRALYGLDVAPRSWTIHRNQVLGSIKTLRDGTPVSCKQTQADANLWEVFDEKSSQIIAYIGVYVDDLLLVSPEQRQSALMDTLRSLWTTSDPEMVSEGKDVSFAGYEIRKVGSCFRIHQNSYVLEMLRQWEVEEESSVHVSRKLHVCAGGIFQASK